MKGFLSSILAFALVFVFLAATAQAGGHLPDPEAEEFWHYITETNPYQGWGYWPGHTEIYPGQSPHGAYLKLYANSIALKAVRNGQTELPPGSMIVKMNFGKDKETLKAITPMYKVEGYNPEAGDWFWAKYTPGGEAKAAGKVGSCIQCHKAQEDNDWIFTEAK
jgi:hypothetical protein